MKMLFLSASCRYFSPAMLSTEEMVELLEANDTFDEVPRETLAELAEGASERDCSADEILIEQGIRCGDMFVVVEGDFAVLVKEKDDEPGQEVARVGRGRVIGEIGAVSGIGATATVQSVNAGKVLSIPGRAFSPGHAEFSTARGGSSPINEPLSEIAINEVYSMSMIMVVGVVVALVIAIVVAAVASSRGR